MGVACGKLDQSCEVYCRKEHLLYMDLQDDSYTLIPQHKDMKPYKFAIFFSGLERSLAGSAFNMRVDECRSAAYALKAYAGMPYGKFEQTNLRDVPRAVYEQYKDAIANSDIKNNQTKYKYDENGTYGELLAPTRTGYTFMGWTSADIETPEISPKIKNQNYSSQIQYNIVYIVYINAMCVRQF